MNKELIKNNLNFESIKHIDEEGNEFWYARELMIILQYSKWVNFKKVIKKSKQSCENSNVQITKHFADIGKLSKCTIQTRKIEKEKKRKYLKKNKYKRRFIWLNVIILRVHMKKEMIVID